MSRELAALLLRYARLERKRSRHGLAADEAAQLEELTRSLARTLTPKVPPGAERRGSIRVPAELTCQWAPVARPEDGRITILSRTGAFIRTPAPAPVGERISISIALPSGGSLEVPGSVANHVLGPDPERRGMGVRFGRLPPEAMEQIDGLYEAAIVRQYGRPAEDEPTSG